MHVSHLEEVLYGVVPHDVLRVQEVGDGGVGDAKLGAIS
jgi:hypothetical protein